MKVIANIEKDGHQGGRILAVTAETTIGVVMTWLKMLEDDGYKIKSCQFCRSRNGFETPGLVPDKVDHYKYNEISENWELQDEPQLFIFAKSPDEVILYDADGTPHTYKFDDQAWSEI